MRVLMIEDDLDIAGNVGDFLEAAGHQVDFAYAGISGMHLALTRDFDVIIIDWMLPGMAGTDLSSRIRWTCRSRLQRSSRHLSWVTDPV